MEVHSHASIALPDSPYKEDAASALADIFDIGVNICGFSGQAVAEAFIACGLARQFERQNPVYVAGKSGSELLDYIMPGLGGQNVSQTPNRFDRTPDYWLGQILALYQVETGQRYQSVFETVSYDELVSMYHPLHEAHRSKFFQVLDQRLRRASQPTRLRAQRDAIRLSQSELSERARVGLRSIQMYEQRNKDINKAQAATLFRLSRALHCTIEDLLEAG